MVFGTRGVSARRTAKAFLFVVALVVVAVPVRGETAWVGQKPTVDTEYRAEGAPVRVWNTFSNSVLSTSIGVEIASFDENYGYTSRDMYVVRVLGAANVRRGNLPAVSYYSARANDYFFELSGIASDDVGKWFSLNDIGGFWYYGRLYTRVYVCSNGWAAFQYAGGDYSWCPYVPQGLPTRDSSGVETPDGVVAPLWRDLNPGSGGQIGIGRGSDFLSFVWKQVPNFGNPSAINTFTLTFRKDQSIRFEYGTVSFAGGGKVGLEDPAGVLGQELNFNTAVTSGGVNIQFKSYVQLMRTSQFVVDKQDASDTSDVLWDANEVSGVNVRASNPTVSAGERVIAAVVTEVAVAGLCLIASLGNLGCLLLSTGVATSSALADDLSSVSPDKFTLDHLGQTERTGYLQVPIRDEQSGAWSTDMSVFDIFLWKVPKDSARHVLEIQFGVHIDCMMFTPYYPCAGPLGMFWTGVVLTVSSGGFLFSDTFERNPWTPGTDPSAPAWLYWTMDGLWHMTGRRDADAYCACYVFHSAWYGRESSGNYDTGSRTYGALTSPLMNVRTTGFRLDYFSWWSTETGTTYDKKLVQISIDRGATWTTLTPQISDDPAGTWVMHTHPLDGYAGKEILVRFYFDSVDSIANTYEGWYIDHLKVWVPGTRPPT